MWRDWSLTTKLSILFTASTLLGLVSFAILEDTRVRTEVIDQARERNLQRARATAQLLDFYLASVDANVQLIAVAPGTVEFLEDVQRGAHREHIAQVLQFARDRGGYDAAFALDPTGAVVIATDAQLVGRNYATALWFRSAVAGRTAFDEPRYDAIDGKVYLHVSAPVTTPRGAIVGVAVVRLTMAPIDRVLAADVNFDGHGAFGVLFDDNGIRLSHSLSQQLRYTPFAPLPQDVFATMVFEARYGPSTETILKNTTQLGAVAQRGRLLLLDETTDPHIAFEGRTAGEVETALAPLKNKRWVYGVASPQASIFAQVNADAQSALQQALAIGLVALIVSVVGARLVTRPIRRVAETARALSSGDLSRRVGLKQRDEMGQLAAAFDAMAESLAEKDAQLRGYATELERKVQARTQEIQRLLGAEHEQRKLAESLREQTEQRLQHLTVLRNIDLAISSSLDIQLTLQVLLEQITAQLHFDAADVLLLNPHTHALDFATGRGFRTNALQHTHLRLGDGLAGRAALERRVIAIADGR